jgi:hypothetical protein
MGEAHAVPFVRFGQVMLGPRAYFYCLKGEAFLDQEDFE